VRVSDLGELEVIEDDKQYAQPEKSGRSVKGENLTSSIIETIQEAEAEAEDEESYADGNKNSFKQLGNDANIK